ncbi:MAG: class I SAM-dependent rRNA methyltransferase [Anaerolineales bacterium]
MGGRDITKVKSPAAIVLKPRKESSVLARHPWVFSGAIQKEDQSIPAGEIVEIYSNKGEWLARGAYSPSSQIRVRIWTWEADVMVNPTFLERQFQKVYDEKQQLFEQRQLNAYRLIYAEADGFPGLIVDKYMDVLVVQFLSWACEYWRQDIIQILINQIHPSAIIERSDSDARTLEGLEPKIGKIYGQNVANPLLIQENGILYWVDIYHGHKTGFYLDQRQNRLKVKQYAQNRDILDCFCYTGGMALPALAGGAKSIECIDSSIEALALLQKNFIENKIELNKVRLTEGDVFRELRRKRDQGKTYDMVILDPPKFAPTVSFVPKATRAYKDINLLGLKLLNPGGILVTFSCSGGISQELFQKIIFGAALDAKRDVKILEYLHQSSDHGVALNFPESAYLKGFILYVK